MTAPVSTNIGMNTTVNNQNSAPQPIGAFGLGGSKSKGVEAGSFVVNPATNIYKYSVYDELELGKDRYKEILTSVENKKASKELKRTRRDMIISKIINWGLLIGAGVLAYKYRSPLKTFFTDVFNKFFKKTTTT